MRRDSETRARRTFADVPFERWAEFLPPSNYEHHPDAPAAAAAAFVDPSMVKRVSLDSTESVVATTPTRNDDGCTDWTREEDSTILLEIERDLENGIFLGVALDQTAPEEPSPPPAPASQRRESLEDYFERRRAKLAASMERSKQTRGALGVYLQQQCWKNLADVVRDIDVSSRQVYKVLWSDEMLVAEPTWEVPVRYRSSV
jgi:hypothetical protein